MAIPEPARLIFLKQQIVPLHDPRAISEAPAESALENYWQYRDSDWRIICDIQGQRIVVRVLRVRNRQEVYR